MKGSTLKQYADEAPEAGFAPVNYGRLTATPMVVTFGKGDDKHAPPERKPMKDGQTLAQNQQLELKIEVNISELNPSLQFEYERSVAIRKSGRNKTDWSEIVLPSLIAVFGEDWADAILKSPYVEVEDVNNVNQTMNKAGTRVLGVPKFLRVFKNKAECVAAREARFGGAGASSGSGSGDVSSVPGEIIEQVKGLAKSVGRDAAAKMLESHPFGPYEPENLLELAGV